MKYIATIGEHSMVIEVLDDHHVILDGKLVEVDFDGVPGQPVFSLLVDGESHEAYVYLTDDGWQVLLHGRSYQAVVEDEMEKRLRSAARGSVSERAEYHMKAPMPGMVVAIHVEEGMKVEKGTVLVVLESMKMQNELKSPRAGTVMRLRIQPGDKVEQHQTLLSVI